MIKNLLFFIASLLIITYGYCIESKKNPKIVGLVQVRNESGIIEQCLRALAVYTDAIVVLDDASEDKTVSILHSLAEELHIERIIVETTSGWAFRTELENRQKLLDTGREIGGTHFIELDADEVLSAHCAKDNWLKNQILSLKPGQILHLPLINLWKSFEYYRSAYNDIFPDITNCSAIFCDDVTSTLKENIHSSMSGFIHCGRFPGIRKKNEPDIYIRDINYSILHLPFVNWKNIQIKMAWYLCLERIRLGKGQSKHKSIADINNFYKTYHNYSDEKAELSRTPDSWLNYPFFDKSCFLQRQVQWKKQQINQWRLRYGSKYFKGLDADFSYFKYSFH